MKATRLRCVLFAAVAAMGLTASAGTTYFVSLEGVDDEARTGTSTDASFRSIAFALGKAVDGDTIKVAAGTYGKETAKMSDSSINVNSQFFAIVTKAVTIEGEGEDKTILDGTDDPVSGRLWYSRGVYLNNPDAVVTNLAIVKCQNFSSDKYEEGRCEFGMAVHVIQGRVTCCRISNNRPYYGDANQGMMATPLYLTGATSYMDNCIVTNNGSSQWGKMAPVYCKGATVSKCYIAFNYGDDADSQYFPGGICVNGGTLSDSQIVGNYMLTRNTRTRYAGGVLVYGGGIVERCYIASNNNNRACSDCAAGGLYASGPCTVRNCIFEGNFNKLDAKSGGAAVLNHADARMYHCTMIGNRSDYGVGGLSVLKGRAVGIISYGNGRGNAGVDACVFSSDGHIEYSCFSDAPTENDSHNININPKFTDAENPYVPMSVPCRDSVLCGSNLVTDDYNGKARPAYDETAEDSPDMGAIECEPSEAAFSVVLPEMGTFPSSGTIRFQATVFPVDTVVSRVDWTFTCGETVRAYEDVGLTPELSNFTPGTWDVAIKVTRADGESVSDSWPAAFVSKSGVCYVSLSGSDEYPYDRPENAAHTLKAAIDSVYATDDAPGIIYVDDGDYPVPDDDNTFNYAGSRKYLAVLQTPIRIIGNPNDPNKVHFNYDNKSIAGGGFYLLNAGAVVTGVSVSGKRTCNTAYLDGSAFRVEQGGVVSNCVVRDVSFKGGTYPQPYVSVGANSWVRNVCVSNCQMQVGDWGRNSLGVVVSGGVFEDSLITDVNTLEASWANCLGVEVAGGVVRNVTVCNCSAKRTTDDAPPAVTGFLVTGGTLENSVVSNCVDRVNIANAQSFAGIRVKSGVVRNCLSVNNESQSEKNPEVGAGLDMWGGTAYNVTVWGSGAKTQGVAGLRVERGTLKNTIVWGGSKNGDDPSGVVYSKIMGGTVACCCYEGGPIARDANGNFAVDPLIRKADKGDYRIGATSPCANVGDNAIWGDDLASALDLAGNRRLVGRCIDLGVYEAGPTGVALIIR